MKVGRACGRKSRHGPPVCLSYLRRGSVACFMRRFAWSTCNLSCVSVGSNAPESSFWAWVDRKSLQASKILMA